MPSRYRSRVASAVRSVLRGRRAGKACPADRVRTPAIGRSSGRGCGAGPGFGLRLTGSQHDRAYPAAFEVLLFLLRGDFFRRERWERLVGQVHFEFGDRQEQRLWRTNFVVLHITFALGNDVRQQVAANGRLNRAFEIDRWKVERLQHWTDRPAHGKKSCQM